MRYDVVTFDCYGTLIDWNEGIRGAFARAAAADNIRVDAQELRELYAEIEPTVEAETYRDYRQVLAETARRAAARSDWMMADPTAEAFAASLPEWRPFADTNEALERLAAAGIRLGILSNVDRDLLEGTLRHFRVEFEIVVTAQDVGSYKPAHGHFIEGRRRVGGARWLHAAQSYFHDIVPCDALKIDSAWINRQGEEPGGAARPVRELSTLADLADWIGRR